MRRCVFLSVLLLTGCGGMNTSGVLQNSLEPAQAEDCRKPKVIYDAFRIHAKELTWRGSQLTAVFDITNITQAPISLTGASRTGFAKPDAVHGGITLELISASGTKFNPNLADGNAALTSMFQFPGYLSELNPNVSRQTKVVFEAPRGAYTLTISRLLGGAAVTYTPEVFTCLIPAV